MRLSVDVDELAKAVAVNATFVTDDEYNRNEHIILEKRSSQISRKKMVTKILVREFGKKIK